MFILPQMWLPYAWMVFLIHTKSRVIQFFFLDLDLQYIENPKNPENQNVQQTNFCQGRIIPVRWIVILCINIYSRIYYKNLKFWKIIEIEYIMCCRILKKWRRIFTAEYLYPYNSFIKISSKVFGCKLLKKWNWNNIYFSPNASMHKSQQKDKSVQEHLASEKNFFVYFKELTTEIVFDAIMFSVRNLCNWIIFHHTNKISNSADIVRLWLPEEFIIKKRLRREFHYCYPNKNEYGWCWVNLR